tara:strand:+ start:1780 stop:3501 length:1722 start_codon:yes stop_codon:yes gene_type:complete
MTYMPIQLPPGIVRGANPDDAPGRWFDGNLIRWRDGVMEPVGGWSKVTTAALGSTARLIHQWKANNSLTMTLIGCDGHLYADNSGAYVDVAPADLVALNSSTGGGYGASTYGSSTYGTPRTGTSNLTPRREAWTLANWGEDVLGVASSDGRLLYFDASSPSTDVTVVGVYAISTISRTSNVTTIVTSTPHNLTTADLVKIAGVTDATFNISSVSATVTNSTTFTYANAGSNGSSSGGSVQDLTVPTGNRAVVVTPERHAVLIGAGNQPRRVAWSSREDYTDFNFTSTTNTAGFLDLQVETNLVTGTGVREGTLIWAMNRVVLMRYVGLPFIYGFDELGTTSIYSPNAFAEFDGRCVWIDSSGFMIYEGGSMKPLACPLTDYIFSDIDPLYGPRVSHASINGKFDEVWFYYPSNGSTECDRYVVWNWAENWWSMGTLARTAAIGAGVGAFPLMTGTDNNLYQHEYGWTYDAFDCANNIFIASGTINLPGVEQSMNITQVVPSNGGNYDLTKYTLFTRMTPNGAERQFGPYYSRSDGYVDTRATGRDVRIRICANDAGDWSIGRLRMKISAGGRR